MEPIQNYQILLNLFLISFKLLLLETTTTFSRKPSEHSKSTLLTLLHKMRLLEAILLATQILQMNPTLVNSLVKRKSIQWIERLLWALIMQD